jgi:hypothetical protein
MHNGPLAKKSIVKQRQASFLKMAKSEINLKYMLTKRLVYANLYICRLKDKKHDSACKSIERIALGFL